MEVIKLKTNHALKHKKLLRTLILNENFILSFKSIKLRNFKIPAVDVLQADALNDTTVTVTVRNLPTITSFSNKYVISKCCDIGNIAKHSISF